LIGFQFPALRAISTKNVVRKGLYDDYVGPTVFQLEKKGFETCPVENWSIGNLPVECPLNRRCFLNYLGNLFE